MKIRPLHDRLIVKRVNEENKTKGGIIIPDTAKEKPQQGKVIAAGNGKVKDDGARRDAIRLHDRSILVEAGAGSGKTAVMAGRIAAMLAEGVAPRSIAALMTRS